MRGSILALATTAAAQSQGFLAFNPGGAIPANVEAPDISGFENATIAPSRGGLAVCVSGFVPVKASTSKNMRFNYSIPKNQSQVTETLLDMVTSGSPFMEQIMDGMQAVNGTYMIGATLCTPANDTKPTGVQLLSHGIGFDRNYWDFAPGYSYVDVATKNNYATFFYDRLGAGLSETPDALNVVQSPLEVEILNELATMLKNGYFSQNHFSKVIGTGHSFGSILTQAVTAMYPSTFDGAILTGFSVNSTALPTFLTGVTFTIASQNQPYRFSSPSLSNGYLVSGSISALQTGFFRFPNFDPQILSLADATKGTATIGEIFTITTVVSPAKNYTGFVAVVNGANDFGFCFGNCTYPTDLSQDVFPVLYPGLGNGSTGSYLAPVTGHGLNLHYSAVKAYTWIQQFIAEKV